ncbi:alpha/beta hydrolase (plasmid) [Croceibacterium sp. TMG7-5b_MA50]|uniref:alpha/beta hydrolase n=1 Tax=Croceibacterium sp. TMG7-5b_MA50 TaxID=3121290 RepID=UPI0032214F30
MAPAAAAALAAMGGTLGPDLLRAVHDLYRAEQLGHAAVQPALASDVAYGPDPLHRLDLYAPVSGIRPAPVLVWVHGGGFVRGSKGGGGDPFNAHAARWAARAGMLGAAIDYRLAPAATWPAGAEDVAAAVNWLVAHAAHHGGDPTRIVLMGTSAGAVHVAGALALRPDLPVSAAVLLSGLYGFEPLEERDTLYYGPVDLYAERAPRHALVATTLPLFAACAERDPARFQRETLQLLAARAQAHGTMGRGYIAGGHNHFSLAYHLGTADTRLADEVAGFLHEHLGEFA